MLSIPNQLEAAYQGQDVTLECQTEAYPASINYWTTDKGDMIISGNVTLTYYSFQIYQHSYTTNSSFLYVPISPQTTAWSKIPSLQLIKKNEPIWEKLM